MKWSVKVYITGHDQGWSLALDCYYIEQQELERAAEPREILWQLYLHACHGVQRYEDHETKVCFPLPVRHLVSDRG